MREDWHQLADLLCDQFVALGYRRPAVARIVGEGDLLLLVLGWSEREGRQVLDELAPVLAELVSLDTHREVLDLGTSVTFDCSRAMVSFVLGGPVDEPERFDALQGWWLQVRSNTRREQARNTQRQRELVRLRAEMTGLRAELRAHR